MEDRKRVIQFYSSALREEFLQKPVEVILFCPMRSMAIAWKDLQLHLRHQFAGSNSTRQRIVRIDATPHDQRRHSEPRQLLQTHPMRVSPVPHQYPGRWLGTSQRFAHAPSHHAQEASKIGQPAEPGRVNEDKLTNHLRMTEGNLQANPAPKGMAYHEYSI